MNAPASSFGQPSAAGNSPRENHRAILEVVAHRAMLAQGLLPDFSAAALAEITRMSGPAEPDHRLRAGSDGIQDLRKLLWASIDNDDSLDLDQLTAAEALSGGRVRLRVAVADVVSLVPEGSAIDEHARHNTTSVYTAARVFPMLPERLSTDLTSLNFGQDRLAMVVEFVVEADGTLQDSGIYRARVTNHAKLAYRSVAAWLEGTADPPRALAAVPGLAETLRLQDGTAQRMKANRHLHGALTLETVEPKALFDGDQVRSLVAEEKNRAQDIIEDLMIAANGVTARFLSARKFPSIRRVVRTPKRWDRIVALAAEANFELPKIPNSKALEGYLIQQKVADPVGFPDLSLAVIKLLGAGEYMAELPGEYAPGHFGLAVKDYTHSTAPNRRYPDLLTQRLLMAAVGDQPVPYDRDELQVLAVHCTEGEDAANKVERAVAKSAAALWLQSRVGEQFDSIVTGASGKGTWVRPVHVPVEGKLVGGFEGLDVGDRVHVQLVSVDVERGFIDFQRVRTSGPRR